MTYSAAVIVVGVVIRRCWQQLEDDVVVVEIGGSGRCRLMKVCRHRDGVLTSSLCCCHRCDSAWLSLCYCCRSRVIANVVAVTIGVVLYGAVDGCCVVGCRQRFSRQWVSTGGYHRL